MTAGCEKQTATPQPDLPPPSKGTIPGLGQTRPQENIDAAEKAAAANLKASKCPIQEQIYAFRVQVRQAYNKRQFDELESIAADARQKKELFGDGSWKLVQFYYAFECDEDEPESMWKLHDEIHRAWVKAKPASITANVALADFLVDYGWKARGAGFAHTVTEEGWRLFRERLAAARQVLREGSALAEKDPYWAKVALVVARAQGWDAADVDKLVDEAAAAEPTFWLYQTERATSLMPRWHGEPGDWERYAEKAAADPKGLGPEIYARIVLELHGYHDHIFRETKASWLKTRDGLRKLREKHPASVALLSSSALLGALAEDRAFAKEMFDQLGMTYLPRVWGKPTRFTHVKHWAETGNW
jgi:hypothetical protein